MQHQRGFTLVELLIALTVFAVISGTTVGVMGLAINSKEKIEAVSDQITALERTRSLMRLDIAQIADRPYRDDRSVGAVSSFVGGRSAAAALGDAPGGGQTILGFVRHGWSNPGAVAPRPSIQHVRYVVRGDQLIRQSRVFVDATRETPVTEQVLQTNIRGVDVTFYGPRGWQDDWRPQATQTTPAAVRIAFVHPDFGEISQAFLARGSSEQ